MKLTDQKMIEEIAKALKALDIEHQIVSDDDDDNLKIIQAAFDINIRTDDEELIETRFPLTVMPIRDAFDDLYARFTITPFIEKESPALPGEIYKELAEINNKIPVLKFAVDGDNDIELIADFTLTNISPDAIETTLNLMADYVNITFPYLLNFMSADQASDS